MRAGIRVRNYSSFIQDDWKVSNRLTMNIGVRYEYTTPVMEVANRMANFDMATNKVVLAAPGSLEDRCAGQARPKQLRSAGRHRVSAESKNRDPHRLRHLPYAWRMRAITTLRSILLSRQASRTRVISWILPRPFGPVQGFPPVGFADGIFDNRFLNINGRPYDFPAAYSQQWNFTIGRQLRDYAFEVAYVGNKANKLMANRNINQPTAGRRVGEQPAVSSRDGAASPSRSREGTRSITGCKPKWRRDSRSDTSSCCPTRGRKRSMIPTRRSFRRRAAPATCRTSSTFVGSGPAPSRMCVTGWCSATCGSSRSAEAMRGVETYLRVGTVWWAAGSSMASRSYQSGRAFTINSPFDHSNTGSSNIRPDATGISPDLPSDERSVQRWINAAAFRIPDGFAFGNTSRNVGTGPSLTNFDISVFKDIPFDAEG